MRGWKEYLAQGKLDMVARLRHVTLAISSKAAIWETESSTHIKQTRKKEDQSSQSSSTASSERHTRS